MLDDDPFSANTESRISAEYRREMINLLGIIDAIVAYDKNPVKYFDQIEQTEGDAYFVLENSVEVDVCGVNEIWQLSCSFKFRNSEPSKRLYSIKRPDGTSYNTETPSEWPEMRSLYYFDGHRATDHSRRCKRVEEVSQIYQLLLNVFHSISAKQSLPINTYR